MARQRQRRSQYLSVKGKHKIETAMRAKGWTVPQLARQCIKDGQGNTLSAQTIYDALASKRKDIPTLTNIFMALDLRFEDDDVQDEKPGGKHPTLCRIPREQNEYFTGRECAITALRTELERSHCAAVTQALSGLGGMGKTSTAIEYAYRCLNKADYPAYPAYTTIQFTRADTAEVLKYGYADIANALQLPRADRDNLDEAVQAVIRWMTLPENAPWLLILDNADDPAVLDTFLPQEPQRHYGHVLITSRSHDFGNRIKRVGIEAMNEEEGVSFLYKRTERERIAGSKEEQAASGLVLEMGGLPLVLEQAAAYMTQGQAMPFEDYLVSFRDQKGRSDLMMQVPEYGFYRQFKPQTSAYTETLTVLTTWQVSLAGITREHPAAVELLRLCAFLHPVGIPRELVIALLPNYFASAGEDVGKQYALYNGLLNVLTRYSLIQRDLNNATHNIHIMVQTVLRDTMQSEEQRQACEQVLIAITSSYPIYDWAAGGRGALYHSHAERIHAYLAQIGIENESVGRLLNYLAVGLYCQGRYTEAESQFNRALAMRTNILPPGHPDIADSLNDLAFIHHIQERFPEAESLYQQALAIRQQAFLGDHLDIAETLNNLAELYNRQARYADAEPFYQQALAMRRNLRHPLVVNSLVNLAGSYRSQRRFVEAEFLYQEAMQIHQQATPDADFGRAFILQGLARTYRDQARHAEAERLFQQVVDIFQTELPTGHLYLVIAFNSLANTYRDQSRHAEAEKLYQKALTMGQEAFSDGHPSIADILNDLAEMYQSQDRLAEAELFHEKALAMRRKVLPACHPVIAESLNNLAELHRSQGRFAEAEPLYQEAEGILLSRLGAAHPEYQAVLTNYLTCLVHMGKEEEAERISPGFPARCRENIKEEG
jgi:tetratricopeptide (TPR) repeat protein